MWISLLRKKTAFTWGATLLTLFFLGILLGAALSPAFALQGLFHSGSFFFRLSLPLSAQSLSADESGWVLFLWQVSGVPVGTSEERENAVPALAEASSEECLLILSEESEPEPEAEAAATEAEAPALQAVVYCSHTSEEYADQTRINGQAGGVLEVARALADALEAQGIDVILDEAVHDNPYDEAYASSLASIRQIAAEYPEIELFIDVHRDAAISGLSTTLRTESGSYAKMMLVIGSDEKLEHPNWKQNEAFAQAVNDAAESLLSGIMRQPRISSNRYNQHIGTKAILVEVGSTDNTVEEAKRSIKILAEAIVSCLQKE